jgi:hypothetical protein
VVFSNVQPGRYAAIAFHDENGNGKPDKNFLGVPTEPYGFSNNVQGFLGPGPSMTRPWRSATARRPLELRWSTIRDLSPDFPFDLHRG